MLSELFRAGSVGLPHRMRMELSNSRAVPAVVGAVRGKRCVSMCLARNSLCAVVCVPAAGLGCLARNSMSAVVCVPAAGPGCPRGRSISKFVVVLVQECLDFCIKVDEVTVESRGTTRRSNDSVWLLIP